MMNEAGSGICIAIAVSLVFGFTAGDVSADQASLGPGVADLLKNSPVKFGKIVFIKRITYTSSHYYTEYVDSKWTPGGALCVLDLKTGKVTELVSELKDGVYGRFDLSFDARRIIFDFKAQAQEGYRIYEIGIDPTRGVRIGKLRQITFRPANEQQLQKRYRVHSRYHHGTDDMQPCYLPDGGICFISTRCQYGILCDGADNFSTTVLYRMDSRGRNMTRLSNSSVSEESPAVLADGRIMYTRWEYVDKGSVSAKCLWSIRPDGSGSAEIYGNNIRDPNTMVFGRPIPGMPSHYVFLGVPHCCPQNAIGTVVRVDMNKDISTTEPMTHITPQV